MRFSAGFAPLVLLIIVLAAVSAVGGAALYLRAQRQQPVPATVSEPFAAFTPAGFTRENLEDFPGPSPASAEVVITDTPISPSETARKPETAATPALTAPIAVPSQSASPTPTRTGISQPSPQSIPTAPELSQQFAVLEDELATVKASGSFLSPAHYERIKSDLDALENQGYLKSEIERLLVLAGALAPHLQDQQKSPTPMPASQTCVRQNPQLIADITDFAKIQKITAPGSASSEGPKGHSFIWTEHERIPVYAPVAAVLASGSYSSDNAASPAQYLLMFEVKDHCGFEFKFAHLDEPIAAIKAALPATPKVADSRGTPAATRIEFKAGDLIGYTSGTLQAGNWDFGLYYMNEAGVLAGYGSTGMHLYAVCWVDFYAPEKQVQYRRLLEGPRIVCSF